MAKRRLWNRFGAVVLVGCAFLILWRAGLPTAPDFIVAGERLEAPIPGGVIPNFSAQTLDNQLLQVNGDMGHPLILNFWGVWCVPCAEEMPILQRLFDENVPIVGIHVGAEPAERVAAWLQETGITFPVALDDRSLEARFRVQVFPTTFFVDRDGIVRHVERGALTEASLREGLIAMGAPRN